MNIQSNIKLYLVIFKIVVKTIKFHEKFFYEISKLIII